MKYTVKEKSFQFAVRIVNMVKYLSKQHCGFEMAKQILRSGTSIGANVTEAQQAQSRADFVSKLSIALKEASETEYWLRLLRATNYLSQMEYRSLFDDCKELEKMLTANIKTSKIEKSE